MARGNGEVIRPVMSYSDRFLVNNNATHEGLVIDSGLLERCVLETSGSSKGANVVNTDSEDAFLFANRVKACSNPIDQSSQPRFRFVLVHKIKVREFTGHRLKSVSCIQGEQ